MAQTRNSGERGKKAKFEVLGRDSIGHSPRKGVLRTKPQIFGLMGGASTGKEKKKKAQWREERGETRRPVGFRTSEKRTRKDQRRGRLDAKKRSKKEKKERGTRKGGG